ncbi:hypothetical protein WJX77_000726 [Trebouxia sp. C0004]
MSSSSTSLQPFALRLVSIDYYLAKPAPKVDVSYAPLEGTSIEQVPVVRVFGSTPSGQKACVHLHKAFPYFYVPYDNSFPDEPAQAQTFLRQLAQSLEAAMQQHQEPGTGRKQVVHAVQLVRAIPFYGYHPEERLFIKIILYNPGQVTRIATLLQSGVIMNRSFQPHESHVPFLLQFKIDFNLYGMGLLRLGHVLFRHPVPTAAHSRHGWAETPVLAVPEGVSSPASHSHHGQSNRQSHLTPGSAATHSQASRMWTASDIPSQWLWSNVPAGARLPERQSKCEVEVDACVEDILNRQELVRMPLAEAGPEIRMVESLQSMWDEEKLRLGSSPPAPPPEPLRTPTPLCQHVEVVRAQLQAIVDEHKQAAAQRTAQPAGLSTPKADSSPQHDSPASSSPLQTPAHAVTMITATTPAPQGAAIPGSAAAASPAAAAAAAAAAVSVALDMTPAANVVSSPAATPVPAILLRHTQAANLLTGSPLAATPATRANTSTKIRQADAPASQTRPPAAAGMHAPSQATQNTEEADREIQELLAWMRQDEGSSDEEGDMLMALADQAGPTPKSASQRSSQQEVLQRLRQRRMSRLSHSQHEIQGILQCSEPSEGNLSDSADELGDPVVPPAGPEPELGQLADQADIEDMGALAQDIRDADMQEEEQQQQQPAAVDADGVAGRQRTGVFAGEPARSGWTQLVDSVNTHPPLAHQGLRPTLQNQPPHTLRRQAAEQQQQHQQESSPWSLPAEVARPQTDTHGMDFQYDSFSDSHEDHDVSDEPELEVVPAQQLHTDSEAAPQPAEQQQQSSGHTGGPTNTEANAGPHEQQQEHSGTADVIPQVDGTADSDSPSTSGQQVCQRQATQPGHRDACKQAQQASNSIHVPPLASTVSRAPSADSALPSNMSGKADRATNPAQHRSPPLMSAAVPNSGPRRRRSRHVVQHALLLAAAARTAMVAADSPEQEGNPQCVPAAGLQSEPQLPYWSLPPVPPHRRFQSEPQLLEHAATDHPGIHVRGMHRCTEDPGHSRDVHQSSSQVAIIGQQQGSAVSHQPSQSTVAGPPFQAPMASHIISDSRATSEWLWCNRQQQNQAAPSQPLHAQVLASQMVPDSRATSDRRWAQGMPSQPLHPGVLPSQLVSDSRATSDLAWAQGLQAQQQGTAPQPAHPSLQLSSQPAAQNGRASDELPWEQDLVEPVSSSHDHQLSEAAGTAGIPDDLEIFISDSQPAPADALDPGKDSPPSVGAPRQLTGAESTLVGHALNQNDWSAAQPTSVAQDHSKADPAVPHTQDQPAASLAAEQVHRPMHAAAGQQHEPQRAAALIVAESPAPGQHFYIPDQELHHMPTFSNRLNAAGTPSAGEALTPVMMPNAQAHIQAQHGATPSLLVVQDTPQSAAVVTPRTSVKDTPRDQTLPMHRLLRQAVTPYSTPVPFGAGFSTAGNVPPATHSSPGPSSAHDADHISQLSQPQALQLQCQEVLPVPELTLRLSLSDGSSTRSAKAGQTSPSRDLCPSHTHTSSQLGHVTATLQLPTSQHVNAHEPSQSTAILSEGMSLHLLDSGSPPSADKAPSFTTGLGSSAPQLQAQQAGASHARQIASVGLPAPQLEPASAAVAAVTRRTGHSPPGDPAKNGCAHLGQIAGVGTASPGRASFASKPYMQGVEQSSNIVRAVGGQTNQNLSDGNLNAEDAELDYGSGQDSQHPPEKPEDHDTDPEGQHDAPSRIQNPHGSPPDDDMDDPDRHDSESEDVDQPGDSDPDGGSPGYSLTDNLVPYRYKQHAPTQSELDKSMAEQSILPIIHPEAFYGNPEDVSDRPVVFAGLEFKVPSSAVGNLPLFTRDNVPGGTGPMARLKAAASIQQQLQPSHPTAPTQLFKHVPARLPPSQYAINDWLDGDKPTHAALAVAAVASATSTAAQAAAGSGFVMDANTGRLVPLQASATQNSEEDVASSLLGTPYMATQASHPRPPMTIPRRLATAPYHQKEQEEEEEVRPASPKYDERSFFYTTPAAFKPAALSGRPQTQWATEGTFLGPALHVAHHSTFSSQAAELQQQQQQQQSEHVQKTSANQNAAGEQKGSGAMAPPVPRPAVFQGNRANAPAAAAAAGKVAGSGAATGVGGPNNRHRQGLVSQITPPSPVSGVSGPTPVSQAGFRRLVPGKGQQLTLLSIEVHADTRGSLLPDPRYDAVRAIVLAVMDDVEECQDGLYTARIMLFDDSGKAPKDAMNHVQVEVFQSEKALLEAFVEATQSLDPDIILGFEVQKGSVGYLADRGATMDLALLKLVSRTPEVLSPKDRQNDEYGALHASGIHCTGRVVLNVWRILRSELKLNIYTFESCVAAVLQLRTPHVQPHVLTQWFNAGPAGGRWRCLQYWLRRTRLNLALLEQLDLIGRTAELARAFGIDFFSVLSRGSQYRVESMMVRLAHTQNYLMLSPAKEQVANQPAMEAVPLILEPESRFYTDPVLVLDFQSLYPSIIIAYNLCYSTVVGRPAHAAAAGQEVKLGAANYAVPPGTLTGPNAPDKLVIAANGVAYLPHDARPGIVPRLLQEILSTRIMVKGAMKSTPGSHKVLQRVMNARQFGLKLIANVTYGYTSAGFSGRMPMAEIADSIVQSARETLENAIRMVEASDKWKARVVYGDTDSMFVLLPGRSREEAFRIGAEIAREVTASNPPPVTLKFEKVYHPCVLLTKKRYVGYMYEAPSQVTPGFDAKGIETVRRDTCPAVAKTMERSLRLLFATRDLSEVKEYLERQWHKILANRVSVQDFVFAKEVRLGTYSPKAAVVPPAAIVAAKAMATDPRAEPRFAERVPYVVVYGEPGARLVDMVVSPHALVESSSRLRLHSIYYITKQIIPALERIFSLVGADLRAWFAAMPRPQKLLPQKRPQGANTLLQQGPAAQHLGPGRAAAGIVGTIDRYYLSRHCAVCDGLTHAAQPLCDQCQLDPQLAAAVLTARSGRLERQYVQLVRICLHCNGGGGRQVQTGGIVCDSLDCGVYYERRKVAHELAAAAALGQAGLALLG